MVLQQQQLLLRLQAYGEDALSKAGCIACTLRCWCLPLVGPKVMDACEVQWAGIFPLLGRLGGGVMRLAVVTTCCGCFEA